MLLISVEFSSECFFGHLSYMTSPAATLSVIDVVKSFK